MKSELFVINCVKTSERARLAVSEYIPSRDREDLLRTLQNSQRLQKVAMGMKIKRPDVFKELEKVIVASFSRQTPLKLTRDHVHKLLNADTQRMLAEALQCTLQDALQTLFSVSALQETLEFLTDGTVWPLPNNAMQILYEILKPSQAQQLEFEWQSTQNDWGTIFTEEEWLSDIAQQRLLKWDKLRRATTTIQALVEIIEQSQEQEEDISEIDLHRTDIIRAMGLLELRRRLSWIVDKLHDQIVENATNAAQHIPDSTVAQLLLPVLHIYKLGSMKQGIEVYIDPTHILFDLLSGHDWTPFEVDEEHIVDNRELLFSGQALYKVANREVGTFEIKCTISNQREPQIILRAQDIPTSIYGQLENDIPKLIPARLSPLGDKLWQRLLFTSFPVLEPHVRLLQRAVKLLGVDFVQAVILANENPTGKIPHIWKDALPHDSFQQALESENDPIYSEGVDQIIARYQGIYGNALDIHRGNLFSNLNESGLEQEENSV